MFQTYVTSVLSGYCICCSGCTCMLQVYVPNFSPVSDLCYKCFIWMLHTLQCCTCFRHILQASIQNVSSVSDVCCKCIYLKVVVTIHICCKRMFINVSPVSDYVAKVLSCCNISGYRKRAHANAVPAGIAVPTARQEKRSCGTSTGMWHGPNCMCINRHVVCNCLCTCTACRRSSCMQHVGPGVQAQ
jgi:hypothetical protein